MPATAEYRRPVVIAIFAAMCVPLLIVIGIIVLAPQPRAAEGTIVRVIDGDTVEISIANAVQPVRLLGISAPEDNRAHGQVQCLGPEATAALTGLLPTGARVSLTYGPQRHDSDGHLLAGVTTTAGVSASDSMAARGLALDATAGDDATALRRVKDAVAQARRDKVGFFDSAIPCTPEAAIARLDQQLDRLAVPTRGEASQTLAATAAAAADATSAAATAQQQLADLSWLPHDVAAEWQARLQAAANRATSIAKQAASLEGDTKGAAATDPSADPTATAPTVPSPAATDRAVTGPPAADPSGTNPAVPNPAARDPAVRDPAVRDPAVRHPAVTHPQATNPAAKRAKDAQKQAAEQKNAEQKIAEQRAAAAKRAAVAGQRGRSHTQR
ncbi:thermonuclease family protein [Microbacterium terrisoli]|uniref:thermonuclease family protein n=1 Tax=Microbacterium terrisoli TaxID=3242192 RepID=UPI0028046DD9|nr:thermonuclease family protein [Microbacterium protaetiae]